MLAAANNMPDVFQWFAANDQYYQKGLVEPLDDYVNKGIIDLKNVSPNLVDTGKLDGKLYGIPLSTNAKGYYVDPAIYAKAGLTVPAEGYATWEDLEKDLVKLKAVTGAYGGDDVMDTNNLFPYYARQRGFSVYDQSGVTVDEKTYVSFYTMKKRLIKEGLIPPIDVVKAQKGIEDSQTVKGKAAISYVFNNQLAQIEKAAGKDLQLIPLPGPNQEKGYDVRAGLHFAISASSKHKEEAAKFINWFINDPDANKILNGERGVPVSSEIRNILGESADPVQKEIYAFQDKIAANSSKPDPMHPNNYTEIDALFKSLDEQILFDQISPEDAYKTFKEQVAKLLAK
ncbi:putative ABC transporter substrate-binding protein YesO [compost metagenome]